MGRKKCRLASSVVIAAVLLLAPASSGQGVKGSPGFWQAFSDFLPAGATPQEFCSSNYRLEHLIASVPDPRTTPYTHTFDQAVDSIRSSAEEAGFNFDRFWFPWTVESQSEETSPGPAGAPGVLVFRNEENATVLAVFLVGENPRSGLDKQAFFAAVAAIRALSSPPDQKACGNPRRLRILGPTFSGSISSMRMSLEQLNELDGVVLVSGSATSAGNEARMMSGRYPFHVEYAAVVENDDCVLNLFFQHIREIDRTARVAFLAETGTLFGEGFAQAAGRDRDVMLLRFPMDISRVRRGYSETGGARNLWPEAGKTQENPRLGVGQSKRAAGVVPAFAPEETVPAHDAALRSILATLMRERVQLAGIAATNTSDALFLAALIQRHAPNVRAFLLDADVLFLEAPYNTSMTGMLFATNYPLFLQNQIWTGEDAVRRGLRQFTSRYSQGVFNACQVLLRSTADPPGEDAAPAKLPNLVEYSWPNPNGRPERPPVWLTVAGLNGFWPVALLDGGRKDESSTMPEIGGQRSAGVRLTRPSRLWTVLYIILALWCLLHSTAFLYHNYSRGEFAWLSMYWLDPDGAKKCMKRLYLGLSTLCLMALLTALGLIHLWASTDRDSFVVSLAAVGLFSAPAGMLAAKLLALMMPARMTLTRYLGTAFAVAFGAGIALKSVALDRIDSPDLYGTFFVYRSLHPSNGVSPLIPLALLVIGLYAWGITHVRRITTFELRRSCLPELSSDTTFTAGLEEVSDRLTRALRDSIFSRTAFWFTSGVIAVSVLVFLQWGLIRTFEKPWFNLIYEAALIALYAGILMAVARCLTVWFALRNLLGQLEWHPIRHAFDKLGDFSWTNLWKRGGSRQAFTTTTASFERLRRITWPVPVAGAVAASGTAGAAVQTAPEPGSAAEFEEPVAALRGNLEAMLQRESCRQRQPIALYRDTQEKLLAIGTQLEASLMAPFWKQSGQEMQEWTPSHQAALEFIALRFVAYIRYVVLQLREQLEFVSTGFILAVLSLNLYPFEPHGSISTGASFVFAGIGVCVLTIFVQMDRNTLMSRLNPSKARKVNVSLFLRMFSFALLPLLTLLATHFPWIGNLFRSWVQPALEAMR